MDTKQPEALRLAHIFEHPLPPEWSDMVAATKELRRQHTENATLQSGYDAARLEIASLRERVQQIGQLARDVNSRRVVELEAQLAAVGAGGVEPLRKRECLHQISEPVGAECPSCGAASEVAGFVCVDCYYAEQKTGELSSDYVQGFAHGQATLAPPQPSAQAQDAERYRWLRDGEWRDTDLEPFIRLQLNKLWDAKIDAAIAAQQGGA